MNSQEILRKNFQENIQAVFGIKLSPGDIRLVLPPDDKWGDYAWPCFALAEKLKQNPAAIAQELANKFKKKRFLKKIKNVGPYVNLIVSDEFLQESLMDVSKDKNFGQSDFGKKQKVVIEFSGPNTNKPQHIGHARNNCLGQSLVYILSAAGYKVMPVNIINDRGIHIAKSMLAWQEFAKGETPESSGMKGDHLVGKYYVKFGQVLNEEKNDYLKKNKINLSKLSDLEKRQIEDEFLKKSIWMQKAQTLLKAWEDNDPKVRGLWQTMNSWVYQGYKKTYDDLGIKFDKIYYESDNYLRGKDLVDFGLKQGVFYKKNDGSVWIDLSKDGLDEKLVLRSDGTSVYITQDLAVAKKRYDDYKFGKMIYVVASEQDYHFKVLFLILKKIGFAWAENLHHLSYGMVNLPTGRLKSREGQTADADDIIVEMINRAKEVMSKAQKQADIDSKQKDKIARIVGLGALKFFMLGTNPQKNITYDPKESISFDGYTGTFIQYTHARLASLLKKTRFADLPRIKTGASARRDNKLDNLKKMPTTQFNGEEKKLVKTLLDFPEAVKNAAREYNPAIITQYLFNLAKTYNNFYQNHSVLSADNPTSKNLRLHLTSQTKKVIKSGLELLGIEAPEVM